MDQIRDIVAMGIVGLAVLLLLPGGLLGQDQESPRWKNVAELTFVLTAGNASSSTFGFKNTAEHFRGPYALKLSLGAVRTESGVTTRTATGSPEDYTVRETTDKEVTAENYYIKARLDRKLGDAAFLFTQANWYRNTFAGIQNRYGFVAGGGRSWFDEETRRFKTDLGLTYTLQDDVVEDPSGNDSFAGVRGSYDYMRSLTETTEFASALVLDQNLRETEDLRADWTNSISVAMSSRLALKTSLQVLYDKEPALVAVPLGDTEVLTSLKEVDTVFTVAIVASF